MAQASQTYDDMLESLRREFLEGTVDRLDSLDGDINEIYSGKGLGGEELKDFHREVHSLKGLGGTFGFPLISLLAHHLEDYLADITVVSEALAGDMQAYLDAMRFVIEGGVEPGEEEGTRILRQLPVRMESEDVKYPRPKDIQALLIISSRILGRVVEKEMRQLGFRVVSVETPFDAFAMAARLKPDLIIASATLDGVTGVDLSCAFNAMSITHDVPFMILTSFAPGHPALSGAPESAAIIHSGDDFAEGMADGLEKFHLV